MTKNLPLFLIRASLLALIFFQSAAFSEDKNTLKAALDWKTPTSTFGADGRLWVAYVQNKSVFVTSSNDLGKSFNAPILVNLTPQDIYTNGENRPKIAVSKEGNIYLSWTEKTKGRFNGDIHFARSINGGKSFEKDIVIDDDGQNIGHRFDSLLLTPSGDIYLAWLDKRLSVKAKEMGLPYKGISLYYTRSTDYGKTFSNNLLAAEHTCECCRIAISPSGEDNAAIMWRHIFTGGLRDHAISLLEHGKAPTVHRATIDQWKTDACPHHGPSLSPITPDSYHMAWFSHGALHKGLYYARYDLTTQTSSQPRLIDPSPSASHPFVKQFAGTTWLVWKSFIQGRTQLHAQYSLDQGQHWTQPITIASSANDSDHPFIINNNNVAYASWFTTAEGLRLIPLKKQEGP